MYSLTQALCRAALVKRQGIATQYQGRNLTWAETLESVRGIAGALASKGISDNDRVAIWGGNSDVYYQCLFATPWAGGIAVPVNTRWAPAEIVYCLNDSGSRVLLVDESFLGMAAEIRDSLETVELIVSLGKSDPSLGIPSLDDLIGACEPIDDRGRGGDDIAYLYYTGGTTGRSKGVIVTHDHMITNVMQWAKVTGPDENDIILVIAPMFHIAGGMNAVAAAVLGAGICIVQKFDPAEVVREIADCGVTNAALIAVMVDVIVNYLEASSTELPKLKTITYGGSPITQAGLKRAMKALSHTQFYQVYGQSEGGPNISILPPKYHVLEGEHAGKLKSAGQPIPGTNVVIMDENDAPLPAGEVGEICVRGLTISPGYWNLPEQTADAQRGGWLHTGDAGYLDEDGFLYIVDRVKDMIITGGENVYSAEVENVLSMHPAVAECAVIGIPSKRWVEKIHAVVRLREGKSTTEEELIAHCRELLGGFKCPRSVEFREEPFPLSGAAKVLKRELRAPYWEGQERKV
jgi:long-chain acyl-CoA synthetase